MHPLCTLVERGWEREGECEYEVEDFMFGFSGLFCGIMNLGCWESGNGKQVCVFVCFVYVKETFSYIKS